MIASFTSTGCRLLRAIKPVNTDTTSAMMIVRIAACRFCCFSRISSLFPLITVGEVISDDAPRLSPSHSVLIILTMTRVPSLFTATLSVRFIRFRICDRPVTISSEERWNMASV